MRENYFKLKVKTKTLFKFEPSLTDDPLDPDPTTITIITNTTSFTILAPSSDKKVRIGWEKM